MIYFFFYSFIIITKIFNPIQLHFNYLKIILILYASINFIPFLLIIFLIRFMLHFILHTQNYTHIPIVIIAQSKTIY
jgi:hypothetical protein